jgi:hypothetical protein
MLQLDLGDLKKLTSAEIMKTIEENIQKFRTTINTITI